MGYGFTPTTTGDKVLAFLVIAVCALITIGIIFGAMFGGAFVDQSVAVRALQTQGFSQIQITGQEWFMVGFFGCGTDDNVKFDAVAVNPAGQQVKLYVCAGWLFKGATVRSQ